MEQSSKAKRKLTVVAVLAVAVIVVLLGYYLWQNGFSVKLPLLGGTTYQAVFLTNGQVYFGQASNLNSSYVTLRNVYYLQVSQVLQPVQGKKQQEPQQTLTLAKLGTVELHKPKDEMKINRDQILFIEDLEEDSQVVQAIERYKESLE